MYTQEQIDEKWIYVRRERRTKLELCDWTQLPDSQLTEEKKQEWANYRQALRDVTNQSDPFDIILPSKPLN